MLRMNAHERSGVPISILIEPLVGQMIEEVVNAEVGTKSWIETERTGKNEITIRTLTLVRQFRLNIEERD